MYDSPYIQGGFFNWSALKMCQITCKSLQKSSKSQNFLRVWHLVIFRADQLKKTPCIKINKMNIYIKMKTSFLLRYAQLRHFCHENL